MDAQRPPYRAVACVPWFWQASGLQALEEFGDNPPRVAIFNKEQVIWNIPLWQYAPEITPYIEEHYVQYKDTYVYIRMDYYEEALAKIHLE